MFAVPLLSMLALAAAPADNPAVTDVLANSSYVAAVAQLDREHDRIVEDIVTLTEIPAPPFAETKRAAAYLERLKQAGLENVEIDTEGNVMGLYRGTGAPGDKLVMIAAHLDTVFAAETDVKVRREGTRLLAPGTTPASAQNSTSPVTGSMPSGTPASAPAPCPGFTPMPSFVLIRCSISLAISGLLRR